MKAIPGKHALRLLLCLAVCLLYAGTAALAAEEPFVKVGLYYGDSALPGANLQNVTGSGYRMGFVDSAGNFIQLAATDKIKISVVKNRNVFWDGSNYVDSASGVLVGAYHIDTGAQFSDPYSAQSEVDMKRASGQNAFISYMNGVYRVFLGSYGSQGEAQGMAAQVGGVGVVTGSAYCLTVVESGTATILFQFDVGNNTTALTIMPSLGEVTRPITWFKQLKYPGGFDYTRRDGNNITVLNRVSMQDYIKGVVPEEMNASWPAEALKAQALCAKSYMYANLGRHVSSGFDICVTTHCQVYKGAQNSTANSDAAVDAVNGLYILYNGQPIQAYYHSSNGGSTEDVTNVWNDDYPYLRAVPDTYEDLSSAINGRWEFSVTNDMLTNILKNQGYNLGNVTGLSAQYTPAGNVYSLTFSFSNGSTKVFSKESARTIIKSAAYNIATYSQRFTVSAGNLILTVISSSGSQTLSDAGNVKILGPNGQTSNVSANTSILGADGARGTVQQTNSGSTYQISGTGWGHNVGMSQNGAKAMALLGFNYQDIINYYYTGVQIGYLY